MSDQATGSFLQRLKQMLFLLCLAVFSLASLVLLCASPAPKGSTVPFSAGILLDGTFLEKNGVWGGLLKRDVLYDNQIPPQLLLMGSENIQLETGGSFIEPGYFAQDARYQPLTQKVQVQIQEDQVLYEVTDEIGNSTRRSRTITYVDTTPPTIRLTGAAEIHIPLGSEYTEPGYTAADNNDGIITEQVNVSGTVNTQAAGAYLLTYTVKDSAGNQCMERRTVYVDPGEDLPEDAAVPETEPETALPTEEAPVEEPLPEPTPAEAEPEPSEPQVSPSPSPSASPGLIEADTALG